MFFSRMLCMTNKWRYDLCTYTAQNLIMEVIPKWLLIMKSFSHNQIRWPSRTRLTKEHLQVIQRPSGARGRAVTKRWSASRPTPGNLRQAGLQFSTLWAWSCWEIEAQTVLFCVSLGPAYTIIPWPHGSWLLLQPLVPRSLWFNLNSLKTS